MPLVPHIALFWYVITLQVTDKSPSLFVVGLTLLLQHNKLVDAMFLEAK
jgi:hypothetical protein